MKSVSEATQTALTAPQKQHETLQTSAQQTSLSADSSESLAVYQANVSQIIRRCLDLCNWTPLEPEILARRIKVWTDALYTVVPIERLRECFDFAVQHHEGNFPVGAVEVLQAWRRISDSEIASEDADARAAALSTPKRCHLQHESEAEITFKIYLPTRGEYIVPCPNCRPKAFESKKAEILAGKPQQQPLATLLEFQKETES